MPARGSLLADRQPFACPDQVLHGGKELLAQRGQVIAGGWGIAFLDGSCDETGMLEILQRGGQRPGADTREVRLEGVVAGLPAPHRDEDDHGPLLEGGASETQPTDGFDTCDALGCDSFASGGEVVDGAAAVARAVGDQP